MTKRTEQANTASEERKAMPNTVLLRGVTCFNAGHYFEAHEIWETVWNESVGEEKRFVQGLVQLAVGYLKLSSAQYRGAQKLLERGCQTLKAFPSTYAGLQVKVLCAVSTTLIRQLAKGGAPLHFWTPHIQHIKSAS